MCARLAAGLVALVVLLGVLRGGARYFYCPMMDAVIDAPCCGADGHAGVGADRDALELRSLGCCEEHVIGKLPSAALFAPAAPLETPLLALVPPPTTLLAGSARGAGARFDHDNRAGPASTRRHRAECMVFLN